MRITVVSMNFWPEETGTGPVIAQLVEDLLSEGHVVKVIAGVPYYPRRVVPERYRGRWITRESFADAEVYRTWLYVTDEKRAIKKMLLYVSFTLSCLPALLLSGRPDVIISISPPLFVPTVAGIVSRIWRCKHILRLEDMLPDAAIIYGLIRSRAMIRILKMIESLNYRLSDRIVAICRGFARNLEAKGQDSGKLVVIPHYVVDPPDPPAVNRFRESEAPSGSGFLAIYAGNIGHSQGLEIVLETAALVREETRVRFLIVGEGVARERLLRRAEQERLRNVSFVPVQSAEMLDEMLWAADVHIVSQRANVLDINVPSKIFNIMAHGRPMIAAVNAASDAARIVMESGAGPVIAPGDAAGLRRDIERMLADPSLIESRGRSGKEYAAREYSRTASVRAYRGMLADLIARPAPQASA